MQSTVPSERKDEENIIQKFYILSSGVVRLKVFVLGLLSKAVSVLLKFEHHTPSSVTCYWEFHSQVV